MICINVKLMRTHKLGFRIFPKGILMFKNILVPTDGSALSKKAIKAGKRPRTEVKRFQILDSNQIDYEVVERLKLKKAESVYYIERLRFLDDLPVIIDRRFLARKYLPDLKEQDLAGSLPRRCARAVRQGV